MEPFFWWFVIVTPLLVVPAWWVIFKKAGFHPGLSILLVFPLINVFVFYFIAFSRWAARPFEAGPSIDQGGDASQGPTPP